MAMAGQQGSWQLDTTWATSDGALSLRHVRVHGAHSDGPESAVAPLRSEQEAEEDDEAGARVRLVPGPEKQPCELTVRFQWRQHSIHRIQVLSSARTCEVYRQNEGDTDVEYLCTARAKLQDVREASSRQVVSDSATQVKIDPAKLLYWAEMEFEDPDPCVSVMIRLLSLQEKSHVSIGHILIVVSPGPFLAGSSPSLPTPQLQAVSGGGSASSLGALGPLMLQMAQGFSIPGMKNKMSFVSATSAEGPAEGPTRQQRGTTPQEDLIMSALAPKPESLPSEGNSVPATSPVGAKPDASLQDICQRLERLESVCARIETSLSKTLESFNKRLEVLEAGLGRSSGI